MRIAFFCPNGPRHSPLIAYTQALVPLLGEHEVTVILGLSSSGTEMLPGDFACEAIPYEAWLAAPERFDVAFYQFGNPSHLNGFMFEALERHPGVAILHDIFPHQAPLWSAASKGKTFVAPNAPRAAYGPEGEKRIAEIGADQAKEIHRRRPVLQHVLDNSLAVIATREAISYEVQRFSPPGFPVYCIPLPIIPPQQALKQDPHWVERPLFVVPAPPTREADINLLQRAIDHLRHRWPQAVAVITSEGLYRDTLPFPLPSQGIWWPGDIPPSRWHAIMAAACAAIFFSPLGGDLEASPIAQALAYGVFPIVIGDFEDPHLAQVVFRIARKHPQNWAILAAALDYRLRYPQRLEPLLALGKQRALEHYGAQRARHTLQSLLADLMTRCVPRPKARQDVQERLAIRESLTAFAGRALAELGVTPPDKAMLRPFASLIASLVPPASPSPEDETTRC